MGLTEQELQGLYVGRTKEQIDVINYFCRDAGCMTSNINDDEFKKIVSNHCNLDEIKIKAIDALGIDEDETNEIEPVVFHGYDFGEDSLVHHCANGEWVSSIYQITWIFFSSSQIFIYRYFYELDQGDSNECTSEYFYKDVTSFSTESSTTTVNEGDREIKIKDDTFFVVVPGDKLKVAMNTSLTDRNRDIIQAMKQKLREKKG
ncbi:hypothetical protein [Anaerovibrio lipolyticus]|uniref:hypothetical protein n=1 Tax=Anaerovibrio lipolyticus TaxID=82374 RepID=UPI000489F439|nr:hypothetical protein [Anaerovibrio lipolyticus]